MKLVEVININMIFREIQNVSLPMKTAYKIAKFLKEAATEIEFFQSKYQETLAKYKEREGVTALENGDFQMPPEVVAEFNKEIDELAEIEVEVKIDLLEDELEKCNLTVSQMMVLMPFIK